MGESILVLTEDNFDSEVKQGSVLVDFYADWCGPCRILAPILEKIAEALKASTNGAKIRIAKIDIEKAQAVASRFRVTSIPTLILFKEGAVAEKRVGLQNEESLRQLLGIETE